MQPIAPPPVGKTAFRHGLNFGLLQVFFATVILLTNTFMYPGIGLSFLLVALNFLLSLAVYFVAGILAAKQTGRLSAGTYAGMWTGAVYGAINLVISMIIFFQVSLPRVLELSNNSSAFVTNPDAFRTGLIIGGVFAEIAGAALAVGFGAGLGALGGLIGRNKSKFQPVPAMPGYLAYPPPLYPGLPVSYVQPFPPAQPASYPQPMPAEQVVPFTPSNEDQPGSQPYIERPQ